MGGVKVDVFFGGFSFVFGKRGLATLLLFLYVTEEAERKCVRDMPWPLCGRMQYDYKQTATLESHGFQAIARSSCRQAEA
jgi:hypothetical protein